METSQNKTNRETFLDTHNHSTHLEGYFLDALQKSCVAATQAQAAAFPVWLSSRHGPAVTCGIGRPMDGMIYYGWYYSMDSMDGIGRPMDGIIHMDGMDDMDGIGRPMDGIIHYKWYYPYGWYGWHGWYGWYWTTYGWYYLSWMVWMVLDDLWMVLFIMDGMEGIGRPMTCGIGRAQAGSTPVSVSRQNE
jgi:hypothetical protein